MSDDFRTRMRNNTPMRIPAAPPAPAGSAPTPQLSTDADILFAKTGTTVSRPMTEADRTAVSQGQIPMSHLSEAEKRQLMKLGWSEGQPVPPDIAETFAKVVEEYKTEAVRQGHLPKDLVIHEISDLPPQEQERMRQIISESADALRNQSQSSATFSSYPSNVANVLRQSPVVSAKEIVIPDWEPQTAEPPAVNTAPDVQETQPAKSDSSSHDSSASMTKRCVHCNGNPYEDMSKAEIPFEEKKRYLLAIGTGRSFEKEYGLFNNTIRVRFRALRAGELDVIAAWANEKAVAETKSPRYDIGLYVEAVRRHQACVAAALQTVLLQSTLPDSSLFWQAPSRYLGCLARLLISEGCSRRFQTRMDRRVLGVSML